ncbi:MAG TPA: cobalamin-binding protein [Nitrospirales bacterium]|jgi:iron complex transport system substrate-binding protein
MKRRQQGILTGMPFMANISDRTFVDDLGRKVYLARPAKRIISLAPSVTEMLFAVGLDAETVGVTTFCDYPPQAKLKPKIGSSIPNLEAILGLKPDLLIGNQDFVRPDVLAKLDQLRVPVFLLLPKTVEDVLRHIGTVGRFGGREKQARLVVDDLRDRLTKTRQKMTAARRLRVFYVVNADPLISVGSGSYIHYMLEAAGGENIVGNTAKAYPKVSLEEVLRRDPEVMLFPVGTSEGIPAAEQERWRKWHGMSAVAKNRLYQVNGDLVNRPGPRVIEGIEGIARLLHPELFSLKDTAS